MRWRQRVKIIVVFALAGAVPIAKTDVLASRVTSFRKSSATPIVAVRANQLVDSSGRPVTLLGVNRSGTEYACAQGWGIFDGPSGNSSIDAMKSWGINTVRIPMNEDCWLGVNVPSTYSGAVYQKAIISYVERLGAAGMYAILDLHWGAPGSKPALSQEAMPDADHSIAFWTSVATTFRSDPGVLFELFNEPHGVSWACWLSGCVMPGGWTTAGMQTLLDAVRATGARQPVIVQGLQWGNDLIGWLAHRPDDPLDQLVAGFHVYPWNACATASCWTAQVAPVTVRVPVVTTEVGEENCDGSFVLDYFAWAERHDVSPIAWTWDTDEGCLALIRDYAGAPTHYGASMRSGLKRFAADVAADGVAGRSGA